MGSSSTDLTAGSGALSLASLALAVPTGGASLIPAALSAGSTALGATSSILGGEGKASADTYQAEQLDRAAQYGDLKATQTNAQLTRNLSISLGNLDAVRAAAKTDPTSPTGAAVRNQIETTDTEKKNIQVDSIMAQSQEDEANAAYMRNSASNALLAGDIGAGAGILGKNGLGGLPGLSVGLGNSSIGNPTQIGALY
jgi:hypothetical protein